MRRRSTHLAVTGFVGGCREKPFEKTRSTLADVHLRAAVHEALATDCLPATDEVAVFEAHLYRRSSGLARVFPTATSRRSTAAAGGCSSSQRAFVRAAKSDRFRWNAVADRDVALRCTATGPRAPVGVRSG
jgi:hypothetical protein